MAKAAMDRKTLLRVALAVQGEEVQQFAAKLDVTRTHLYLVVEGERESPRVLRAVDSYIEQGCKQLVRHALRSYPALQSECRPYCAPSKAA